MSRFFATIVGDSVILSPGDIHHLVNVMRASVGDTIEIVDQGALFFATITSIDPLDIRVIESKQQGYKRLGITLIYALPKGDKLDLVVQKATELGVDRIVLFQSIRSVVRWNSNDVARKIARLEKIAKQASEQSRRLSIPPISYYDKIDNALEINDGIKLIASESHAGKPPLNVKFAPYEEVTIIIGPEGGFENCEIDKAKRNGYIEVSLGPTILRTETAAIAALAMLVYMKHHATI